MNFLVIEGLDGSGKSTQVKRIEQYFSEKGKKVKYLHFPRTEEGIFGDLVARFLRGDLGKLNEVDPYLVALIYAGDRNDAAKQVKQWMDEGYFVLIDRYVYSNIAFQCAKIESKEEKQKLLDWIHNLEFEYYGIPKPDLSIFLDVPFTFTTQSLTNNREGDDRDYLNGKEDIHEASLDFQKNVRDIYVWQTESGEDLQLIDCSDGQGNMASPDEIFSKIKTKLDNII